MSKQQYLILLSCLFLFMGIGRIFSLVTNDPILGYANNYEMIRLQACHQIWPADKFVDITAGTPAAPLRRYTLEKHVNTPCFPSSELLFTSIGIELGKLKNKMTGESLISIKTIGFVKATFLSLTVLLASIFFYRREMYGALLANALITLTVLSDPGVTLYMNTFYTEFSAVYFLYLALIGVVVIANSSAKWPWCLPLLVGVLGLGFSKPQHMPLALLLSILTAIWLWRRQPRSIITLIALCGAIPLLLQTSGDWTPRNDNMATFNRANALSAFLIEAPDANNIIHSLALQDSCLQLQDIHWYVRESNPAALCPGVHTLRTHSLYFSLLTHPVTTATIIFKAIPASKEWIFNGYGQVEGRKTMSVTSYRQSLYTALQQTLPSFFITVFIAITAIAFLLAAASKYHRPVLTFAALLALLCWCTIAVAVLGDGYYDLAKHSHLCIPLLLATFLILMSAPLQKTARSTSLLYSDNSHD